MKFLTFLKKHFDVTTDSEFISDIQGTNNKGKEVDRIWIYERGEENEPLLILKDAWWLCPDLTEKDHWMIGNVYSTIDNGIVVSESQFKEMVKRGEVKSKF
jgi:hypothetical protein